jgi:hypothetical protein
MLISSLLTSIPYTLHKQKARHERPLAELAKPAAVLKLFSLMISIEYYRKFGEAFSRI